MDVFALRDRVIERYREYVSSFFSIRDLGLQQTVRNVLESGRLWPDPLVQLNPSFEAGRSIDDLIADRLLHPECASAS